MNQSDERMLLFSNAFIKQKEYWRTKLLAECSETRIPLTGRTSVGEKSIIPIHFPMDLAGRLIKLGKQTDLSIYIILLAGLKALLTRYHFDDIDNVTIISPLVEKRIHRNTINTHVYIRTSISPGITVKQLILAIRENLFGAYENQDYPVNRLMEFIFQLDEGEELPALTDIRCEMRNIHRETDNLTFLENGGLVFSFERKGETLEGALESMITGENREFLENFIAHYLNLLNYILPLTAPPRLDIPIDEIPMDSILSAEERRRLTETFNRTGEPEYFSRTDVFGEFLAQVERTPDGIALEQLVNESDSTHQGNEPIRLTYRQLNQRSEALAGVIRNRTAVRGTGSIIGILADAGLLQVIGLLAILKSGNSFVPINPLYPAERIGFIVRDCHIDLFITDGFNEATVREMTNQLPGKGVDILVIEDGKAKEEVENGIIVDPLPESLPKRPPKVEQFCYVIYTSGSTGNPKGVPISNGNLMPLLIWGRDFFGLGSHTAVLQNLSYAFDFGLFEIFTTILFGGALCFLPRRIRGDAAGFAAAVNGRGINTIHTTPGFFSHVVSAGVKMPTVSIVHYGGDVLTPELVRRTAVLISEDAMIYNGYGPTEATINSTIYAIHAGAVDSLHGRDSIPIGKPSANNYISIRDRRGQLLPNGVPGELIIDGERIAAGYLNRPELTAERFVFGHRPDHRSDRWSDHWKVSKCSKTNEAFYKTGDLARWLPDGNIEFLGRIDRQVKIRGYRIELGEIEARLAELPGIEDAVVIDRKDPDRGNYLCSYYIPSPEETISEVTDTQEEVNRIKRHLARRLPDYMVPGFFVRIQSIPLTPNGKIDRNALPAPASAVDTRKYSPPRNHVERELVEIWERLLFSRENNSESSENNIRIGIDDDFFELGGDSLLANRVVARIRQAFEVEISLRDFFERPVIRELSENIGEEIVNRSKKVKSIEPADRSGPIPLSFAQERLWFLHQLDHRNMAYHVPRALRLEGPLKVEVLEAVFTEIVRRHEILRTVFPTVNGQPVQKIREPYPFKIPVLDISEEYNGKEASEQEAIVSQRLREEGQRPFDLEKDEMLRITLLRVEEEQHILVSTEHHLVHDGWTQGVLLREFLVLFKAYREGHPSPLQPLPIQYADYAIWQRNHFHGDNLTRTLEVWKEKLSGLKPVLEMPLDSPRPPVISGRGVVKRDTLPQQTAHALKEYGRKKGTTLFMTMLAAFNLLLNRWTGETDICVGTGAAGRQREEMEGMLGMVINTIPLRTRIEPENPFTLLLQDVKETCVESYAHEDTPLEKIVAALQPERSMSYTPLFQVFFTFMDVPQEEIRLPGLLVTPINAHNRSAKFDINVTVIPLPEDEGGEILVDWEYNTDILKHSTMERMIGHYRRLLVQILNPEHEAVPSIAIPMMEENEIQQMVHRFNETKTDYPSKKTIHRLFEEQARRAPDRIAVVSPSPGVGTRLIASTTAVSLTYSELNQKAERLAHIIREKKGIRQGDIVAVKIERSVEMMMAIYAVQKAGAIYLPVSPGTPGERIRYLLKDSNAKLLLEKTKPNPSDQETINPDRRDTTEVLNLDELDLESVVNSDEHTGELSPTAASYIIYTSGSTGRPKGVQVSHRALVNRLNWMQRAYPVGPGDRLLQKTPVGFDVSLWELFWWGLAGASLYMLEPGEEKNPASIVDVIEKYNVSVIHFVPSMLTPFLEYIENSEKETCSRNRRRLKSLKRVFSSGEALETAAVECFNRTLEGKQIINLYGPTEAAVDVTYYDCPTRPVAAKEMAQVPIGKPIDNIRLFILGHGDCLQPIGVFGELAIAGTGLADGYINKPELTAARFVTSKSLDQNISQYVSQCIMTDDRIYKTGDRARWLEDGNIEFGGRLDHQVKIRGFRIEPGEIENRLVRFDGIEAAAVTVKEDSTGGKRLCAYFVPAADNVTPLEEWEPRLKDFLSRHLPDYMIPALFTAMDELPLTASGKLDRNALPESFVIGDSAAYEPPQGSTEEILAEIWRDVLAVPKVGRNDHFFRLGGDSIRVIQVANRLLNKRLKIENKDIFQEPILKRAAKRIRCIEREIPQHAEQGDVPLTPIQEWFFENDFTDPHHFNHAVMLQRDEGFREELLEKVFNAITEHHDALRMVFRSVTDENENSNVVRQYNRGIEPDNKGIHGKRNIYRNIYYELGVYNFMENKEEGIREKVDLLRSSMNLETGPLVKLGLFKTPGSHHLLITIHHLIVDGVSWRILLEDFQVGYRQAEKGEEIRFQSKTDSYRTWARRLREIAAIDDSDIQVNRKHWEDVEQEETDSLPMDSEVPQETRIQRFTKIADLQLTVEETGLLLKEVHQTYNTEMNDILLAALALALNRWGNIEKIRISLEGHGRESIMENVDIGRTVGWFTSQYPVILEVRSTDSLSRTLKEIKERLHRIPDKGIGYGILRYLTPTEKKKGYRPAPDPMINFNYMGLLQQADEGGSFIRRSHLNVGTGVSPRQEKVYPLDISAKVINHRMSIEILYNGLQYDIDTIDKLTGFYKESLQQIIRHCIERDQQELTPSDLVYTDLDIDSLDEIKGLLDGID